VKVEMDTDFFLFPDLRPPEKKHEKSHEIASKIKSTSLCKH
jgi:hypothetical protein